MALNPILPKTRSEATRWYTERLTKAAEKGDDVYAEARRWLSRNDLFFLLVAELGRKDANRDWIFERCREVQAAPDGHLDLWARGHYKSTIITFALTIQEILIDPEITIGILSDVNKVAKPFLRQIKQEFETNEQLKRDFSDILWSDPQKQAPKWSEDDGIVVRRRGNPKEATVEAYGLIDGQPTGRHFKLLIFDDVVNENTVTSPEMMQKVALRVGLADNLGAEGYRKRFVGTRYHMNDAYAEMIERGSVKVRKHPVTKNGKVDGEPVLLTREVVEQKRRDQGPYVFGCQMLLDPAADSAQGFKKEWLRYWPAVHTSNLNLYMLVDPASKRKANSDYTAIFMIGIGGDDNYYVADMIRDRLNLTGRVNAVMALHAKWQPKGLVGYEEYGLQADIEAIKDEQERRNYRFEILPLGGKIKKEDRIKRLVPLFENGRFFLPQSIVRTDWEGKAVELVRTFVQEEYLAFPVAAHDDMLDCASRILDEDMLTVKPQPPQRKPLRPRERSFSPMAG